LVIFSCLSFEVLSFEFFFVELDFDVLIELAGIG